MNNAVKLFTYLTLAFLLLSSASAMLGGPLSIVARAASVLIPVLIGYAASRRMKLEREEAAGAAEAEPLLLLPRGPEIAGSLPFLWPLIAIIFLISYLTSLLLGALGMQSASVADAPLFEMLLMHALLPSLLEETMFRYLPMKLLAPYSRRGCVIISSLYFALIHMNLFQLPYALVAGFAFIVLDLAYESVWPSFLLHLFNNAISVLWIKYSASAEFVLWFVLGMVALALISLLPIFIRRKKYISTLAKAFDEGERLGDHNAPMVLILLCAVMSVVTLFI